MAHEIWRTCDKCGSSFDLRDPGGCMICENGKRLDEDKLTTYGGMEGVEKELQEERRMRIKRDRVLLGYRNRLVGMYRNRRFKK
jgi:hypothetical protein